MFQTASLNRVAAAPWGAVWLCQGAVKKKKKSDIADKIKCFKDPPKKLYLLYFKLYQLMKN